MGGVHYLGNNRFSFRMINSKIIYNDKVGISCVGDNAETRIEDCLIDNNNGPGIKIGIANRANIVGCTINYNTYGIEMISCEPLIKQNII